MQRRALIWFLLLAGSAAGQDERRVSSPNGQLQFRIGMAQPEKGGLPRLAYQVFYRGKRLVDTSFLGFDIRNQEPLLGENLGLIHTETSSGNRYNTLRVEYMQNGSLGRRVILEIRAEDDGVAFRYLIPRSSPLEEIMIDDEETEFAISPKIPSKAALPFTIGRQDGGWMEILESKAGNYPPATLVRGPDGVLVTRLSAPFDGTTPLACPWRLILVGSQREGLMKSDLLRSLQR